MGQAGNLMNNLIVEDCHSVAYLNNRDSQDTHTTARCLVFTFASSIHQGRPSAGSTSTVRHTHVDVPWTNQCDRQLLKRPVIRKGVVQF